MTTAKSHEELDTILKERLMGVIDQLAEEHGISIVAVCSIEHTDISTVISSMTAYDSAVSMTAALYAFESDARGDVRVVSRRVQS